MTKPHATFEYIRPDEVAECWDGVTAANLYGPLWDVASNMKPLSDFIDIEESCPADAIGINTVASFWKQFTPDQQIALNKLAVAQDAS